MARDECNYAEAIELAERERRRVPQISIRFMPSGGLRAPSPTFTRLNSLELLEVIITPTLSISSYEAATPEGPISWATSFSLSFRTRMTYQISRDFSRESTNPNQPSWVTRIRNEILPGGRHIRGHIDGWSRVLSQLETACYADLRRGLPSPANPVAVREREVDGYLEALGRYWVSRATKALWDESCRWDTEDYRRLQRIIGRSPRLGRPLTCQRARRVRIVARPGPPTAVRLRR